MAYRTIRELCLGPINPVLPLVYDDSLSYYELLCKTVDKCNEIVDELTSLESVVEEQGTSITELDGRLTDVEEKANDNEEAIAGIITTLADIAGKLPTPEAGEEDYVLTANGDGTASWQPVPTELPAYGVGAAKSILMVQSNGTLGWSPVLYSLPNYGMNPIARVLMISQNGQSLNWGSELPTYGSAIAGKVLQVQSNGTLGWGNDITPRVTTLEGLTPYYVDITENNVNAPLTEAEYRALAVAGKAGHPIILRVWPTGTQRNVAFAYVGLINGAASNASGGSHGQIAFYNAPAAAQNALDLLGQTYTNQTDLILTFNNGTVTLFVGSHT